jgi:hypothetical protein
MGNYIFNLKKKYTDELARSAAEYLQTGMTLFHRYRESDFSSKEAVINNLGVSLELILKTYLATKNFGLIFKNIPMDIKTLFTCPNSVPEFYEWRKYNFGILSQDNFTINLTDCISGYYVFFPHLKQLFLPHLDFVSKWTGYTSHSLLPSFNSYDFERFGFISLSVYMSLSEDKDFPYSWYTPTAEDKQFLKYFDLRRVERAKNSIESAGTKTTDIEVINKNLPSADWETYYTKCPVCREKGTLKGYTEVALGNDEEGKFHTLDFFAVSYSCQSCGLNLYDIEEIKAVGLRTLYDRTDALDVWFRENEGFTELFLE